MEDKRSRPFFRWLPQWATVVTIVLVLLLASGGTVAAASDSMPDEPLYQVKLAAEQVQLAMTFSDMGKARLGATLADRRVAEIMYMASKGNAHQVEMVTRRLDKALAMMAMLVSISEVESTPVELMEEAPAVAPKEARGKRDDFAKGNDRAKLKELVANYAVDHPAALRALLKTAPEKVKPALLKAISVSESGYQETLEALD